MANDHGAGEGDSTRGAAGVPGDKQMPLSRPGQRKPARHHKRRSILDRASSVARCSRNRQHARTCVSDQQPLLRTGHPRLRLPRRSGVASHRAAIVDRRRSQVGEPRSCASDGNISTVGGPAAAGRGFCMLRCQRLRLDGVTRRWYRCDNARWRQGLGARSSASRDGQRWNDLIGYLLKRRHLLGDPNDLGFSMAQR